MTASERFEAATSLRACAKFFGKPVEDETIAEYVSLLADLELPSLERALTTIKGSGRFFPKPGDIRKAARTVDGPGNARWSPPRYEQERDGSLVRVFECVRCEDSGFRPACGCDLGHLGTWKTAGECPTHPRVLHGLTYRQALTPCECRQNNRTFQANRPRPQAAPEDAA